MPHASATGAKPGALQGEYRYVSLTVPGSAHLFMVQANLGSVGSIGGCVALQMAVAECEPSPVQVLHPMEQPWENHRQAWPPPPARVPGLQSWASGAPQLHPAVLWGHFPSANSGSARSTALRGAGWVIAPCACTTEGSRHSSRAVEDAALIEARL